MSRDGANPLRCAVPAPRKPGASIPVCPFDVYVSPLEPSSKASLLCTPRHMTTRAHLESRDGREWLGRDIADAEWNRVAASDEIIVARPCCDYACSPVVWRDGRRLLGRNIAGADGGH